MCALKFPLAENQGGEDKEKEKREKRMERESKMAANYPNEMSMDMDATCNFPPQVMSFKLASLREWILLFCIVWHVSTSRGI